MIATTNGISLRVANSWQLLTANLRDALTKAVASDADRWRYIARNEVGWLHSTDKLFGAFQRLHNAKEPEGTGIGLANVRRIVVRHGRRTWATGAPAPGTTVFVALPEPRATRESAA